jgi:hypothetical protein
VGPTKNGSNPYAAPQARAPFSGGIRYGVLQLGLAWYAALGLLSAPVAVLTAQAFRAVVQGLSGAEAEYHLRAAIYHGLHAIADLGLVAAFAAGLAWLHRAWRRTQERRKTSAGAGAVIGWCFVPVWGYWRLFGFLLELSRLNGVSEETVKVQRWWLVCGAHVVVRIAVGMNRFPGWLHVADALLQAIAAVLGMQMVARLQRALAVERSRPSKAAA